MTDNVYHEIRDRQRRSAVESRHQFLVKGADAEDCLEKIRLFFRNYQLLRYHTVELAGDGVLPATSAEFWNRLEVGVAKNRTTVRALLGELRLEGLETLEDLEEMPEGYLGKTLHTATHLLDGFFGIDSYFYNLVEESHQVSAGLRKEIGSRPAAYMLLSVRGST